MSSPAVFRSAVWLVFATAFATGIFAQSSVVTAPVGFVSYTIPAAVDSTTPTTTAICLPLHEAAAASGQLAGTITAVASGTISNSSAGWTSGALASAATPCFVRLSSGAAKGRTLFISANTSTDLTVDNQNTDLIAAGVVVGDSYQIIAGDTLMSLFGTSTLSGTSEDAADNILYWNGASWQIFYFNSTNNRWQQKGLSLSANNFALRPDAGLLFVRRATTPLAFNLIGVVPTHDLRYEVANSGSTFLANGFPLDTTLKTLGYNSLQGWTGDGSNGQTADLVMFWNGASWQRFYYNTANNRWQQVGLSLSADNFTIPSGSPVMIARLGSASGNSTLVHPIPYSLN